MVLIDINSADTQQLEMTTLEWQVILDQKDENGGTIKGGVYWEEKVVKIESTFNYFKMALTWDYVALLCNANNIRLYSRRDLNLIEEIPSENDVKVEYGIQMVQYDKQLMMFYAELRKDDGRTHLVMTEIFFDIDETINIRLPVKVIGHVNLNSYTRIELMLGGQMVGILDKDDAKLKVWRICSFSESYDQKDNKCYSCKGFGKNYWPRDFHQPKCFSCDKNPQQDARAQFLCLDGNQNRYTNYISEFELKGKKYVPKIAGFSYDDVEKEKNDADKNESNWYDVFTEIDVPKLWEDLKAFATKDEKNIMLLSMIVCAIGVCCSVMCMMCCCRSKASDHQDVDEEMA